jgi:hypothetical protein
VDHDRVVAVCRERAVHAAPQFVEVGGMESVERVLHGGSGRSDGERHLAERRALSPFGDSSTGTQPGGRT